MLKTKNILFFCRRTAAFAVDLLLLSFLIFTLFTVIKPHPVLEVLSEYKICTDDKIFNGKFSAANANIDFDLNKYTKEWASYKATKGIEIDYINVLIDILNPTRTYCDSILRSFLADDKLKLFGVFLFLVYGSLMVASRWRATVGNHLFGIYVEPVSAQSIRLVRAFMRAFIFILLLFPVYYTKIYVQPDLQSQSSSLKYDQQAFDAKYVTNYADFMSELQKDCEKQKSSSTDSFDDAEIKKSYDDLEVRLCNNRKQNLQNQIKSYESALVSNLHYMIIYDTISDEAEKKIVEQIIAKETKKLELTESEQALKKMFIERTLKDAFDAKFKYYALQFAIYLYLAFLILFMLFNRNGQAVHDVICKTRVVRGRPA